MASALWVLSVRDTSRDCSHVVVGRQTAAARDFYAALYISLSEDTAHRERPGRRAKTERTAAHYHPVQCGACKGSHLIDPTTGETWRDPTELRHSARPHVSERRFRKPWRAEETDACFIIRDHNDQALVYVYYEEEPGQRSAANLLSRDEARRIAVNKAKLPELQLTYGT